MTPADSPQAMVWSGVRGCAPVHRDWGEGWKGRMMGDQRERQRMRGTKAERTILAGDSLELLESTETNPCLRDGTRDQSRETSVQAQRTSLPKIFDKTRNDG